jgi:hypothetical protein
MVPMIHAQLCIRILHPGKNLNYEENKNVNAFKIKSTVC